MRVCELEAGRPRYQVPRFQRIAGNQQCEHHREPGTGADIHDQFDRQGAPRDAESDRATADTSTPVRFQQT